MIVDSVDEVLRIPQSSMEPAPRIVTSVGSDYINGVAKIDKRLLIFLDISKIAGEISREVSDLEMQVA